MSWNDEHSKEQKDEKVAQAHPERYIYDRNQMYGKGFQLYVFSVYFSPVLPSENEQDGRFGIIKNRDLTGISFFSYLKK